MVMIDEMMHGTFCRFYKKHGVCMAFAGYRVL